MGVTNPAGTPIWPTCPRSRATFSSASSSTCPGATRAGGSLGKAARRWRGW